MGLDIWPSSRICSWLSDASLVVRVFQSKPVDRLPSPIFVHSRTSNMVLDVCHVTCAQKPSLARFESELFPWKLRAQLVSYSKSTQPRIFSCEHQSQWDLFGSIRERRVQKSRRRRCVRHHGQTAKAGIVSALEECD